MEDRTHTTDPVSELQSFLVFLGSMWGALAGLSVVFPLSNVLADVIPLSSVSADGAFVRISPAVVTAVSTVSVLFSILWLFGTRQDVGNSNDLTNIRKGALLSFSIGLVLLVAYLGLYELKLDQAYSSWGWESDDLGHILVEVPLMALYSGFFVLLTRAFVLLGLIEFYGNTPDANDSETDSGR
jgi:hypothetical protein